VRLILSLFPGIGLLDMAFEQVFDGVAAIVRGPDLLWGGDIQRFHVPAGQFWGIIGGPPCQAFSRLRYLVEANGYELSPNRIPEYERVCTEAQPDWFLMENVPDAPEPIVPGYMVHSQMYNNRWAGGEQNRERRWSFGARDGRRLLPQCEALESAVWSPAVLAHGGNLVPVAIGGNGKRKKTAEKYLGMQTRGYFKLACRLQGLPEDFDLPPFTVSAKIRAVGNGVPLPMGLALAEAVKRAMGA
jgi:DNA (cytosine-5)-methyltransferase 1